MRYCFVIRNTTDFFPLSANESSFSIYRAYYHQLYGKSSNSIEELRSLYQFKINELFEYGGKVRDAGLLYINLDIFDLSRFETVEQFDNRPFVLSAIKTSLARSSRRHELAIADYFDLEKFPKRYFTIVVPEILLNEQSFESIIDDLKNIYQMSDIDRFNFYKHPSSKNNGYFVSEFVVDNNEQLTTLKLSLPDNFAFIEDNKNLIFGFIKDCTPENIKLEDWIRK